MVREPPSGRTKNLILADLPAGFPTNPPSRVTRNARFTS
jgi:hypothetical protein